MRFLLTTTAIGLAALGATAASAQDSASSWTGFYVGGQLGYGWQPKDGDEVVNDSHRIRQYLAWKYGEEEQRPEADSATAG